MITVRKHNRITTITLRLLRWRLAVHILDVEWWQVYCWGNNAEVS